MEVPSTDGTNLASVLVILVPCAVAEEVEVEMRSLFEDIAGAAVAEADIFEGVTCATCGDGCEEDEEDDEDMVRDKGKPYD